MLERKLKGFCPLGGLHAWVLAVEEDEEMKGSERGVFSFSFFFGCVGFDWSVYRTVLTHLLASPYISRHVGFVGSSSTINEGARLGGISFSSSCKMREWGLKCWNIYNLSG